MSSGRRLAVQPYKAARGELGQRTFVPDGLPVVVRVEAHPLVMDELDSGDAEQITDRIRISYYGRQWPGGRQARYGFDGQEWDQVQGDAVRYTHVSRPFWIAVLQRRGERDG